MRDDMSFYDSEANRRRIVIERRKGIFRKSWDTRTILRMANSLMILFDLSFGAQGPSTRLEVMCRVD